MEKEIKEFVRGHVRTTSICDLEQVKEISNVEADTFMLAFDLKWKGRQHRIRVQRGTADPNIDVN